MSDNGRVVETKPIVSTIIPTTEAIVARTREPSRPPHDEGGNRILQRLSPRRRHWPEVTAYDERAGELERRVAALNEEIAAREAARSARCDVPFLGRSRRDRRGARAMGAARSLRGRTGLRPEEWAALEWRDVERGDGGAVTGRRAYTRGRLKEWGKTDRSRRGVPLRQRVLGALDDLPRRIDSRLVFAAPQGGHVDLHNWRSRDWKPALAAAGLEYRLP